MEYSGYSNPLYPQLLLNRKKTQTEVNYVDVDFCQVFYSDFNSGIKLTLAISVSSEIIN